MKSFKTIFFFIVLFEFNFGFGQGALKYLDKINLDLDTSENELTYSVIDTFYICQDLNPIRRSSKSPKDTVSLKIRFEANWSESKKDSIHQNNLNTFKMIHTRLINHFVSTNDYVSMLVQYEELKTCIPCAYKVWHYIDSWTLEETNQIKTVSPIPDYILNDQGVFVYLSHVCVMQNLLQTKIIKLEEAYKLSGRDSSDLFRINDY